MVTLDDLRSWATQLSDVTEEPHFEKTSFRVRKKIFATYDPQANNACLKLSAVAQDLYTKADSAAVKPVPNKWGAQGWTLVEMKKVKKVLFKEAMLAAYKEVAPATLSKGVRKPQGDF